MAEDYHTYGEANLHTQWAVRTPWKARVFRLTIVDPLRRTEVFISRKRNALSMWSQRTWPPESED